MVWPLQSSSSDSGPRWRRRLQVLHEHDACCFGAGSRPEANPPITGTRHAQILAYNRAVQAESKGWMCTAVTTGAPLPQPPSRLLSVFCLLPLRRWTDKYS